MKISARGKDEQRTPNRRIELVLGDRNVPARDVGEEDEVDLDGQTVCSSAIASASSRMPIPSSSSSRVIVSGGQIMITFQCVMR
jgi:hypothetical protein